MGENGTSAGRRKLRGIRSVTRIGAGLGLVGATLALAACGGGNPRQDVDEPAGEFPVDVTKSQFAPHQSLAETNDLELEIKNVGSEPIPNLAVTIWTGERKASRPFVIRLDDPTLADPNRPVWILENGYPKLLTPGISSQDLDDAPSAGAVAAQTDTFQFGTVNPGDSKDIVWRVTAVKKGTYTVHYEVAAGLEGKAVAVTQDGGPVEGEFVVTISAKPPQTCVQGNQVVPLSRCEP